jgi:hypothetical protein
MVDLVGTTNTRIVDSVTGAATLLTGQSPSQAFAMLDAVMVETLGMAMYNAVNRQQNAGMTSAAAVTAACARMLGAPFPAPPPPPPPAPPAPPVITPLPGPPTPPSPGEVIAAALTEGQAAISILQAQAAAGGTYAQTATADLQELSTAATAAIPVTKTETTNQDSTPGGSH